MTQDSANESTGRTVKAHHQSNNSAPNSVGGILTFKSVQTLPNTPRIPIGRGDLRAHDPESDGLSSSSEMTSLEELLSRTVPTAKTSPSVRKVQVKGSDKQRQLSKAHPPVPVSSNQVIDLSSDPDLANPAGDFGDARRECRTWMSKTVRNSSRDCVYLIEFLAY